MELTQLLDQIRTHFVQRLVEAIADERAGGDATVVHEPALRNGQGEIVRSGPLDTPSRVDIVKAKDGEVVESINVDTDEILSFTPFDLAWPTNNLAVTIEPFPWNWLQIQATAAPNADDWQAIRDWYMKWFGEDDPAINQLAGAVHFFGDPNIDGSAIQLTIDLGTAPVEAFEELLDALGHFGATDVRLGLFPAS